MSDRNRKTFAVTVADTLGPPHEHRRLAGWLKAALRRFGLVCLEVKEVPPEQEQHEEPARSH